MEIIIYARSKEGLSPRECMRTSRAQGSHAPDERRAPAESALRTAHLTPPYETLGVCPENTYRNPKNTYRNPKNIRCFQNLPTIACPP